MRGFGALIALSALVRAHSSGADAESAQMEPEFSMADLVHQRDVPAGWTRQGDAILEEGRFRLTPKKSTSGSLWWAESHDLHSSFTVEWTFRSTGFTGKSEGGLAFWAIDGSADTNRDKGLFGGPAKFKGLQLFVDNNGPVGPSIRAVLNDGSAPLKREQVYEQTFAYCLMGYQDSSVPTSARLTYDKNDNHLLKLQIDNKVCFQTRKVKLPPGSYKLGYSASNADNNESFEILKVKFFNGPIEDSYIPNVHAMPQPKLVTQVVDKETGKKEIVEKEVFDSQQDKITNYELFKKLDRVEGKVLANDISSLEQKYTQLMKSQEDLLMYITQLTQSISRLAAEGHINDNKKSGGSPEESAEPFKDFFALNDKMEKIWLEQQKIREQTKHHQNASASMDDLARKLALWLFPLVAIMCVMAYYTFKIRQEIIKTKLL